MIEPDPCVPVLNHPPPDWACEAAEVPVDSPLSLILLACALVIVAARWFKR